MTHTPTPWRVIAGDDYYITADDYPTEFIGHFKGDDNGPFVALVGNRPKDFGEANAAMIVRAVNNHIALVKALGVARRALSRVVDSSPAVQRSRDSALAEIDAALSALPAPPVEQAKTEVEG